MLSSNSWLLARTRLSYGEFLRRGNRRNDARHQLSTAHDMFATMGAQAFAERARRELVATGEKVRKQPIGTGDHLTAQEAQIAGLAASGLTNAEIGAQLFISTHTVEWHLRKVFVKLGIKSRRQLRTRSRSAHTRSSSFLTVSRNGPSPSLFQKYCVMTNFSTCGIARVASMAASNRSMIVASKSPSDVL